MVNLRVKGQWEQRKVVHRRGQQPGCKLEQGWSTEKNQDQIGIRRVENILGRILKIRKGADQG